MRKSFSLAFFFFPLYFPGTKHSLRKEKNAKENDFFMFGCLMKNIKENQI